MIYEQDKVTCYPIADEGISAKLLIIVWPQVAVIEVQAAHSGVPTPFNPYRNPSAQIGSPEGMTYIKDGAV